MVDLMEYIKVQWTDIHNTRNQDWKVLVIIVGIFYALFRISPQNFWLHIAVTISGLIASGMGIYMSLSHWWLIFSKIRIIELCEEKLGILGVRQSKIRPPLPVQGLIMLFYFFIAGILFGWLVWLLFKVIWISFVTFFICFLIGFIICIILTRWIKTKVNEKARVTFENIGEKNE